MAILIKFRPRNFLF